MNLPFDEFSKSLAESLPRRESLRRLGAVFAGAALMPFSFALAASKAAGGQDACKSFCSRCSKKQQSQCLAACQACNGNTSRLCGSCGNYACCNNGLTCCNGACVDLFDDFDNCGGCGNACDLPGPYEEAACINGACLYRCVAGASLCNGICTDLDWDPDNCGTCGNVCGGSTPLCIQGVCSRNPCVFPFILCGGVCVDPTSDHDNCGGCGNQCGPSEACLNGFCESGN